jgi:hypothetical protein
VRASVRAVVLSGGLAVSAVLLPALPAAAAFGGLVVVDVPYGETHVVVPGWQAPPPGSTCTSTGTTDITVDWATGTVDLTTPLVRPEVGGHAMYTCDLHDGFDPVSVELQLDHEAPAPLDVTVTSSPAPAGSASVQVALPTTVAALDAGFASALPAPSTWVLASDPAAAGGTVVLDAAGQLTFTPVSATWSGSVAYAVQAVDAVGWTRTIRGTLTIAAPAVVPPAVVPPTVVPPVADPAVATVAAAPAATAVRHASLAATGSPTGPTLAVALGLAAAGAGLLVLARRGGRRARAEVVSRS